MKEQKSNRVYSQFIKSFR